MNSENGQDIARNSLSNLSSTDYGVNQIFWSPTTLYFSSAQEADDFMSYVNYDTARVIQYYSEHPDFFRRQLYYNGIIDDTTSSLRLNPKCSTCEMGKGVKPMDSWGSFCQNYMSTFNQICVGMEYDWTTQSVSNVTTTVSGWELGFGLTDLGGSGEWEYYGEIKFTINFQISLSLFWGGIGSFYYFHPESHWGYFWPNTGLGTIFQ